MVEAGTSSCRTSSVAKAGMKADLKTGDLVKFRASLGVLIQHCGYSPYYGEIWEVYVPSTGQRYQLGEYRLQKIK